MEKLRNGLSTVFDEFEYDLLPKNYQFQANKKYRVVSRQPVDISSDVIDLKYVTDETFYTDSDTRATITRSVLDGTTYKEYVSIIGYSKNIISAEVGFNHKRSGLYIGAWAGASDNLVVPAGNIRTFFKSRLRSIMIDEIIIHRYVDGHIEQLFNLAGINYVNFTDTALTTIQQVLNPVPPHYYDIADLTHLRTSPIFHWKSTDQRECILTPSSAIVVKGASAIGTASTCWFNMKFRCN